jgi:hypothetical protein
VNAPWKPGMMTTREPFQAFACDDWPVGGAARSALIARLPVAGSEVVGPSTPRTRSVGFPCDDPRRRHPLARVRARLPRPAQRHLARSGGQNLAATARRRRGAQRVDRAAARRRIGGRRPIDAADEIRVVVTRSRAFVRGCPDLRSDTSPDLEGKTSSGYGRASG